MDVKKEIKQQIVGALKGADFPIETPKELLNAFPEGADTTCAAGDVEITAGEAGELLTENDFPFTDPEKVAETVLNAVEL